MKKFRKSAQSLIEYGLILGLVAVIAMTILTKFSKSMNTVGDRADQAITTASDKAFKESCNSAGGTWTDGTVAVAKTDTTPAKDATPGSCAYPK